MLKIVVTAISALLLLAPSLSYAQTNQAAITGTVTYRERIALPSDAAIDVQLVDTSVADVAVQTVAESMLNAEGRQVPIPFTLNYDPALIVPTHRYSLRATIRSGDGMLLFSTTQAYPVLTHGAPSKVNLILHTVGHGSKPGAAKKAAPALPTVAPASQTAAPTESAAAQQAKSATTSASDDGVRPAPSSATTSEPVATQSASPDLSATPAIRKSDNVGEPSSPAATPVSAPKGEAEREPAEEAKTAPALETRASEPSAAVQQVPEPIPPPSPLALAPAQPQPIPQPEIAKSAAQAEPVEAKASPSEAPAKTSEPETPLPDSPSAAVRATAPERTSESPTTMPSPGTGSGESERGPSRSQSDTPLSPLADTQWRLTEMNGTEIVTTPPDRPLTLAFSPEGARIAGSAGCNSYRGSFSDYDGLLHLNPGALTMMGCGEAAAEREQKFVAMLRSADGYKIDGESLLLTSDGKTVAKFRNIGQ